MAETEEIDPHQLSGKYHRYMVAIFNLKLEEGYTTDDDIPFDKTDIEKARQHFDLELIKNVPDLPYNLRSRGDLPEGLLEHGYEAVVQNDEAKRHEAAYLLTKEPDTIYLDDYTAEMRPFDDSDVPGLVEKYASDDEQGILTRVRYTNVLSEFTGLECHHLQSHLRTAGESGQVEIDDLYIGADNEEEYALVVEGKGRGEKLSRNQIERNTRAVRAKQEYPDKVRTLGIKVNDNGDAFSVVEFNVPDDRGKKVDLEMIWKFPIGNRDQQTLKEF